eukprot:2958979-Lingulodinium_polyedra.AAC.1
MGILRWRIRARKAARRPSARSQLFWRAVSRAIGDAALSVSMTNLALAAVTAGLGSVVGCR